MTLSKTPTDDSPYLLNDLSEYPYAYQDGQEWGKGFTFPCDSLPEDVEALSVMALIQNEVELDQCVLVIEIHDAETASLVLWHSSVAAEGHFPPGNNVVADAIVFSDNLSPKGKTVKTYLWNQDKKPIVVNKMSYYFTRKCKVLTGLYEPLN